MVAGSLVLAAAMTCAEHGPLAAITLVKQVPPRGPQKLAVGAPAAPPAPAAPAAPPAPPAPAAPVVPARQVIGIAPGRLSPHTPSETEMDSEVLPAAVHVKVVLPAVALPMLPMPVGLAVQEKV